VADEFYAKLLDNIYDGVYYVDQNRSITYWNKSAEKITGYTKEEVVGKHCSDNILRHIDESGKELCINGCPLWETLHDGRIRDVNVYLHHKKGHRIPINVRVSPIFDENEKIVGAIEIFSNKQIDDETRLQIEKLKKEVYTDQLTGISNRKYADLIINKNLEEHKAVNLPFGLLFLDVDHFKNFNDTYGHKTGDEVLIMVANTVNSALRNFDTVCRMGGEEFIVILPNIDHSSLNKIAERVRVFVEKSWIEQKSELLKVTVSIGGTMAFETDTASSLIERADRLMYKSKTSGRNRVTID